MDSLSDINNFMETETESSQELIEDNNSLLTNDQIKIELSSSDEDPLIPLRTADLREIPENKVSQPENVPQSGVKNDFKTTAMTTQDGNTLVIPANELAQMFSLGLVEGLEFEQINAENESEEITKYRMARLVPVPGSRDSYYLSYEDTAQTEQKSEKEENTQDTG